MITLNKCGSTAVKHDSHPLPSNFPHAEIWCYNPGPRQPRIKFLAHTRFVLLFLESYKRNNTHLLFFFFFGLVPFSHCLLRPIHAGHSNAELYSIEGLEHRFASSLIPQWTWFPGFRACVKAQSAKLNRKRCVASHHQRWDPEGFGVGIRAVWTRAKSEAVSKAGLGEAGITLEMRAI